MSEVSKKCTRCLEIKGFVSFYKKKLKSGNYGTASICKECHLNGDKVKYRTLHPVGPTICYSCGIPCTKGVKGHLICDTCKNRTEKACTKCLKVKPLDRFAKRSVSPDGLQQKCKICQSKQPGCFRCGVMCETQTKFHGRFICEACRNRTEKVCTQCSEIKKMELFSKSGAAVDGRTNTCQKCTNKNSEKHRNITRAANWEWYCELKDSPCMDCGKAFPPEAMDFDHIGPKTRNIGLLMGGGCSRKTILKEIANCELVCSNCHRIRTYSRLPKFKYNSNQIGSIFSQIKNKPCLDCQGFFPPALMDFDHRDPEQKIVQVSDTGSWSLKRLPELMAEIAKCDLICGNCHRVRTSKMLNWQHAEKRVA